MKESKSNNAEIEPIEESSDILRDEVIARAVSEDPLFKFLKVYWRQVLVVVGAVLAGYFGNQFFEQSYIESMKRSGDILAGVHQQLAVLEIQKRELGKAEQESAAAAADAKKSAEEKDSAVKKAAGLKDEIQQGQDRLKELLLALSDSRKPYDSIARIYQGILAAQSGDMEAARTSLEGFDWQALKPESKERFFAETAGLALAGAMLDDDAAYSRSRELLKSLATGGAFLNIAAAIRLGRISLSPDERKEALAVIEDLRGRFPEQAALLDAESSRLRH